MEKANQDSNTFYLLDMDTPDKKVITIPDQTIVKMNDSIYLFYKGNIIKSHHGFDLLKHKDRMAFFMDPLDLIELDNICRSNGLFPTAEDDSGPIIINYSTGDIMKRKVEEPSVRDSDGTSQDDK